jgi:hypothetical protein
MNVQERPADGEKYPFAGPFLFLINLFINNIKTLYFSHKSDIIKNNYVKLLNGF